MNQAESSKSLFPESVSDSAPSNSSAPLQMEIVIDTLLPFSKKITCPAGEDISLGGERAFYYVEKGVIEVSYTADHTKITVALIGQGDFFGEIGFFDGKSRVREIRAGEDAEILSFSMSDMEKLYEHNPLLYGRLVTFLTQRICKKFRRILDESQPVTGYAASLVSSRRSFTESAPLPESLLKSPVWHSIRNTIEELKARLFNISFKLQQDSAPTPPPEISDQCFQILDTLNGGLAGFKAAIEDRQGQDLMWGYVFKEVFPYIMRSRFVERAYYKPKGYAGDFLMMEHIYRDRPEGDGKLGIIVDAWCQQRPGARAIRGRRKLLARELATESARLLADTSRIRVMNLACGPNRELFDFLADCEYSEAIEALCVDIDSEALQYTNQHVNIFPHRASIRLMSENLVKWALGRVRHEIGKQHIIYSAGLCDYLEPRLFKALAKRCHDHLEPGGHLILGNFAPYEDMIFMDEILHWQLLYRTADDLRELFSDTPFGTCVEVLAEEEQVNLFVKATKI